MSGVARQQSKQNYKTENYRLFHESLIYVCEYEDRIYNRLDENEQIELDKLIVKIVEQVDDEVFQFKSLNQIEEQTELQ